MKDSGTPSGWAASIKVLMDAVTTAFGAAVLVLTFFGLTLLILAARVDQTGAGVLVGLMYCLIGLMVLILAAIFVLRLVKPSGLAGPPSPETEDVTFEDTSIAERDRK